MKLIAQFLKWYNKDTGFGPDNKIVFWAAIILIVSMMVKILQMNGYLIAVK